MRGNEGCNLFLGEVLTISIHIYVRPLDTARLNLPLTARERGH